jgi:hypothetical protein
MITTQITITVTCSNEYHDKEVLSVIKEIQSGQLQREWETGDKSGSMKVKATAIVLDKRK